MQTKKKKEKKGEKGENHVLFNTTTANHEIDSCPNGRQEGNWKRKPAPRRNGWIWMDGRTNRRKKEKQRQTDRQTGPQKKRKAAVGSR